MSNVKVKAVQIGNSGIDTDNYLIYQPITADGTFRISNGNFGTDASDVFTINADGDITVFGTINSKDIEDFVEGPAFSNPGRVAIYDDNTGKFLANGEKFESDLVTGPVSSTDNRIAVFDGESGKIIKNGSLTIDEIIAQAVPSGVISMWSGSLATIPSGWSLCDGTNGTPDLRDKFIVGAGSSYSVSDTGGENSHILTSSELPSHSHAEGTLSADEGGSHSHTGSTSNTGSHSHSFSGNTSNTGSHSHSGNTATAGSHSHQASLYGFSSGNTARFAVSYGSYVTAKSTLSAGDHSHTFNTNNTGSHSHSFSGNTNNTGSHSHSVSISTGGSHSHTISGSTATTGSGNAHENRPPYYSLAYIMKL